MDSDSKHIIAGVCIMAIAVSAISIMDNLEHERRTQLIREVLATPEPVAEVDWRRDLFAAIVQVESGGDLEAYNGAEQACGPAQIRPIMVDDVNRITGKHTYMKNDRFDLEKSYEMFLIFSNHYNPGADAETLARCWNGGPRGDTKTATLVYWEKVKAYLTPPIRRGTMYPWKTQR